MGETTAGKTFVDPTNPKNMNVRVFGFTILIIIVTEFTSLEKVFACLSLIYCHLFQH